MAAAVEENTALRAHLLELQQQQLDAIGLGDYDAYAGLCAPDLTCFEPEAKGHLVVGMDFHETYFKHPAANGSKTLRNTISQPKVQLLGGEENPAAAVISYVRLVQSMRDGAHVTTATQETRVWERTRAPWSAEPWGTWVNVHLHRSPAGP